MANDLVRPDKLFIDIFCTDFGPVRLSGKTVAYLNGLDGNWHKISNTAPRKNESAKKRRVRKQIADVTTAVMTVAAIEWASGGKLETF